MPKEQEYTGASFELARPDPNMEEKRRDEAKRRRSPKPVTTGVDFELSRPADGAEVGRKAPKHAAVPLAKRETQKSDLSPAQRFFLARPGEGAVSAPNDAPRKGGRER